MHMCYCMLQVMFGKLSDCGDLDTTLPLGNPQTAGIYGYRHTEGNIIHVHVSYKNDESLVWRIF